MHDKLVCARICVPLFFRISESRKFLPALSMLLLLDLAARRNIFMLVQIRVSILLFLAGLASLGMAVVETLASVPEHTKNNMLQI